MNRKLCILILGLVAVAIFVSLALIVVGKAEAAEDCPWPPHAVYTIHIPLVSQYVPVWWDGDNSGDGVELGR